MRLFDAVPQRRAARDEPVATPTRRREPPPGPVEIDDDEIVAMVSHVPKVGTLAAQLGELARTPSFVTGAVCLVEVRQGRGRGIWMLDPDTLTVRRF